MVRFFYSGVVTMQKYVLDTVLTKIILREYLIMYHIKIIN